MIQSMTGFGRGASSYQDVKILTEIRSLNSKLTDLRIKFPAQLGEREIDLRNHIIQKLQRGKIEVTISFEGDLPTDESTFDKGLIQKHFTDLKNIVSEFGVGPDQILHEVLKLPNLLKTEMGGDVNDLYWEAIIQSVNKAMEQLIVFREHEGRSLYNDLLQSAESITQMCSETDIHDAERTASVRTRLRQKIDEFLSGEQVDQNRFEQELIFYLERMDINEEKVRLKQHCNFFIETLNSNLDMKSRQLNFIAQEIGREINTIGAKAQWSPLQHLVVGMKNELEKIKEQLANIV